MKNILLIISLLLVIGCGTRKVNKTDTNYQVKEQISFQDSIYRENLFIGVKIDTSSIWSVEYEPIDSSKVMIVDKINHKYQNVRFKTQKIKNGISISKTNKDVLKSIERFKKENKIDYSEKYKEINRKTSWFNWLIILIIIGIIGIAYADFKRW